MVAKGALVALVLGAVACTSSNGDLSAGVSTGVSACADALDEENPSLVQVIAAGVCCETGGCDDVCRFDFAVVAVANVSDLDDATVIAGFSCGAGSTASRGAALGLLAPALVLATEMFLS